MVNIVVNIYNYFKLSVAILKMAVDVNLLNSCKYIGEFCSSQPMVKFYGHISMHGLEGQCKNENEFKSIIVWIESTTQRAKPVESITMYRKC